MTIEPVSTMSATYQGSASKAEKKPIVGTVEPKAVAEEVKEIPDSVRVATEGSSATAEKEKQAEQEKQGGQIRKAVEDINKNNPQTEAIFGIHEGTNRVTIKIVDKESRKVVKEYPPEKTLDMIEKVWEMAGLMVDEKR